MEPTPTAPADPTSLYPHVWVLRDSLWCACDCGAPPDYGLFEADDPVGIGGDNCPAAMLRRIAELETGPTPEQLEAHAQRLNPKAGDLFVLAMDLPLRAANSLDRFQKALTKLAGGDVLFVVVPKGAEAWTGSAVEGLARLAKEQGYRLVQANGPGPSSETVAAIARLLDSAAAIVPTFAGSDWSRPEYVALREAVAAVQAILGVPAGQGFVDGTDYVSPMGRISVSTGNPPQPLPWAEPGSPARPRRLRYPPDRETAPSELVQTHFVVHLTPEDRALLARSKPVLGFSVSSNPPIHLTLDNGADLAVDPAQASIAAGMNAHLQAVAGEMDAPASGSPPITWPVYRLPDTDPDRGELCAFENAAGGEDVIGHVATCDGMLTASLTERGAQVVGRTPSFGRVRLVMVDCPLCIEGKMQRDLGRGGLSEPFDCIGCDGTGKVHKDEVPMVMPGHIRGLVS